MPRISSSRLLELSFFLFTLIVAQVSYCSISHTTRKWCNCMVRSCSDLWVCKLWFLRLCMTCMAMVLFSLKPKCDQLTRYPYIYLLYHGEMSIRRESFEFPSAVSMSICDTLLSSRLEGAFPASAQCESAIGALDSTQINEPVDFCTGGLMYWSIIAYYKPHIFLKCTLRWV